jgi:HAD superfamily hydrolase (TIGR01509 family)
MLIICMDWVVFDVGNVVVKADHAICHMYLEARGVHPDNAENFFKNQDYREFSRGNISAVEFHEALVRKYLKCPLPYDNVVAAHDAHIYGVEQGVIGILSSLKQGRLAFLTDTNPWQMRRVGELVDLEQYTDRIFCSHEMHKIKTDPGCFHYVAAQLMSNPEKILLVDDSSEKVEAARKSCWQAIKFEYCAQLEKELQARYII